jgi:hypothetical protein
MPIGVMIGLGESQTEDRAHRKNIDLVPLAHELCEDLEPIDLRLLTPQS